MFQNWSLNTNFRSTYDKCIQDKSVRVNVSKTCTALRFCYCTLCPGASIPLSAGKQPSPSRPDPPIKAVEFSCPYVQTNDNFFLNKRHSLTGFSTVATTAYRQFLDVSAFEKSNFGPSVLLVHKMLTQTQWTLCKTIDNVIDGDSVHNVRFSCQSMPKTSHRPCLFSTDF